MKQKAVVTNPGKVYTTYREFANQYGYPDAAVTFDSDDHRPKLAEGTAVNLLTCGPDPVSGRKYLHIVETPLGYRYIIAEGGLRFLPPDPMTIEEKRALIAKLKAEIDEEVVLKAGDYARVTSEGYGYREGAIVRVLEVDGDDYPYLVTSGVGTHVGGIEVTWLAVDDLVKLTPEEAKSSLIAHVESHFSEES